MDNIKKFLNKSEDIAHDMEWKDFLLLKVCLISLGVMVGLNLPKQKKDKFFGFAAGVFFMTYIPLIVKFFPKFINAIKTKDIIL